MKTIQTHALELSGSSYEAGRLLAAVWHLFPVLKSGSQAVSPASARRSLTRPANVLAAGVPGLTKSWPDLPMPWAAPLSRFSITA